MLYFITALLCILALWLGTPELKGAVLTLAMFAAIGVAAYLSDKVKKDNG